MSKQYNYVELLRWNTCRWCLILARAGGVHRYRPLLTGLVLSLLAQLHLLVEACEPPPDPGLHFSLVARELLWFCLEDIKTMFLLSEKPPGITHAPFVFLWSLVHSVHCGLMLLWLFSWWSCCFPLNFQTQKWIFLHTNPHCNVLVLLAESAPWAPGQNTNERCSLQELHS